MRFNIGFLIAVGLAAGANAQTWQSGEANDSSANQGVFSSERATATATPVAQPTTKATTSNTQESTSTSTYSSSAQTASKRSSEATRTVGVKTATNQSDSVRE